MTFTYIGDLSTSLDKIRFYINDTTEDSGPKPGGGNFSDEELAGLLTIEGGIERTVAGALEILANVWATQADISVGPRRESYSQVSARYAKLAEEWRDRVGTSTTKSGSRFVRRTDGYSDDLRAGDS